MTELARNVLARMEALSAKASPAPWRPDRGLGCKRIMARKGHDNPQSQWRTEVVSTAGLSDDAEDSANAELIALLGTHRDALINATRQYDATAARLAELSALADPDALTVAHLAAHHSRDDEARKLSAERDAARAERDALREALEFYRDEWDDECDGDPRYGEQPRIYTEPSDALRQDKGQRARTALAGGRDDTPTETDKLRAEAQMPQYHELKTWPPYWQAVSEERKPFEVRRNDRRYAVGDLLELREYDPMMQAYTGRFCVRYVTYVLHGGAFGIEPGFVVLGLSEQPARDEDARRLSGGRDDA